MPDGTTRPKWEVGVLLYSGRPDPCWTLDTDATGLLRQFSRLKPWAGPLPDQARLGYRGAWLRAPDGRRWQAYDHVAWLDREADIRRDEGRRFERALLATAKSGVLPPELLELR